LLPKVKKYSQDPESEVYFLKLQADYFRYVAEVGSADDRVDKAKTRALNSYNSAIEIADQLAPADPIRLSLYLNFSVYCYEIYDQKDKAIAIAKQGLAEAEDDIDNIEKVKASESQFILQFLRENLTSWKSKNKIVSNSKRNLFSQQDSEAQFINQDEDEDFDESSGSGGSG